MNEPSESRKANAGKLLANVTGILPVPESTITVNHVMQIILRGNGDTASNTAVCLTTLRILLVVIAVAAGCHRTSIFFNAQRSGVVNYMSLGEKWIKQMTYRVDQSTQRRACRSITLRI
jgi:hypothetical protein